MPLKKLTGVHDKFVGEPLLLVLVSVENQVLQHSAAFGERVYNLLRSLKVGLAEVQFGLVLALFLGFLDEFDVKFGALAACHPHVHDVTLGLLN